MLDYAFPLCNTGEVKDLLDSLGALVALAEATEIPLNVFLLEAFEITLRDGRQTITAEDMRIVQKKYDDAKDENQKQPEKHDA